MDYKNAKSNAFAYGSVPDGYFGKRASVLFTFDPESGKTLVVTESGFFTSQVPQSVDVKEAFYLLTHHPSCRNIDAIRCDGFCEQCGWFPAKWASFGRSGEKIFICGNCAQVNIAS